MYLKCDSQDIRISVLSRLWVGCPRNRGSFTAQHPYEF